MTEILSNKALEKAILDGETTIKITSKRILTACIMAERCGFDKTSIGQFINLVQAAQHDWESPTGHTSISQSWQTHFESSR